MNAALMFNDERLISSVASNRAHRHGSPVTENSVNGLGRSRNVRRNSARITIAGAFFVPVIAGYGGLCVCGHLRVCRGPNVPVGQPRAICHPNSLGREKWQLPTLGATPMNSLNPSAIRAFAHRSMALSALRAKLIPVHPPCPTQLPHRYRPHLGNRRGHPMTSPARTPIAIAEDALDHLEVCKGTLRQLETLLWSTMSLERPRLVYCPASDLPSYKECESEARSCPTAHPANVWLRDRPRR